MRGLFLHWTDTYHHYHQHQQQQHQHHHHIVFCQVITWFPLQAFSYKTGGNFWDEWCFLFFPPPLGGQRDVNCLSLSIMLTYWYCPHWTKIHEIHSWHNFPFLNSFELRTPGSCRCPPSRSCRQSPRQSLWWDRGQRCTAVSGVWQFQIDIIRIFILRRDLSSLLSTSSEQPRVIRLLPWPQRQSVLFDPKDKHCRNCECCPSYMSWQVKLCLSCLCDFSPLWDW